MMLSLLTYDGSVYRQDKTVRGFHVSMGRSHNFLVAAFGERFSGSERVVTADASIRRASLRDSREP